MQKTTNQTSEGQATLSKFVDNNVYYNQTGLINKLLNSSDVAFCWEGIVNNFISICSKCGETDYKKDKEGFTICAECEVQEWEEKPQEILEWWICSDWLLKKLEAQNEPILKTDFGSWWGRTCSGQAIHLDSVIEDIYTTL